MWKKPNNNKILTFHTSNKSKRKNDENSEEETKEILG